ncbi:hypothetical protein MCOR25_003718 [Pyricularia grisea]|uniref:Uncharacterized protein n=1 Tax=Pyricularia grisea TaxID=148305 RepID=A0A6P8BJN6_PYRGI|nr:uncharacterized protein PgNI_02059 [Pyricularia grisea]KAI6372395.1 hypothetical protein MCOR25_003718 [Pyricularia grisea]TLD16905.1 hypothetical protein PgNI_02059 [Pyricularia grisea]
MAPPPTPDTGRNEELSFPALPNLLNKRLQGYLDGLADQLHEYHVDMVDHTKDLKEALEARVRKEARRAKKAKKTKKNVSRQKEQKDVGAGGSVPDSQAKGARDEKGNLIFWSLP